MNMIYILQMRQPLFSQHDIFFFRQQLFTAIIHDSLPPLHAPLSSNDTPFHIPHANLFPLAALPCTRSIIHPRDRRYLRSIINDPLLLSLPTSPTIHLPATPTTSSSDLPTYSTSFPRTLYDPLKYPP
jgi:hypothetical protein